MENCSLATEKRKKLNTNINLFNLCKKLQQTEKKHFNVAKLLKVKLLMDIIDHMLSWCMVNCFMHSCFFFFFTEQVLKAKKMRVYFIGLLYWLSIWQQRINFTLLILLDILDFRFEFFMAEQQHYSSASQWIKIELNYSFILVIQFKKRSSHILKLHYMQLNILRGCTDLDH